MSHWIHLKAVYRRSFHGCAACWRFVFFMVTLFCTLVPAAGQTEEFRAKANFLAAFPNFIEWPKTAFSSEKEPLAMCVFGAFSFGTSLAELTRGSIIRGRRIDVRWLRKESELRACHVLFVSRSEGPRYAKILKLVQGASVLTVGETPDFLANGGVVSFVMEDDRLQFEVNMNAANGAQLQISSNMLALARHVVRVEAAKGDGMGGRFESQRN